MGSDVHHAWLLWHWDFTLEITDNLQRLELLDTGFGRLPQIWLRVEGRTKLFVVSYFMVCSSIAETQNAALIPTL